LESQHKTHANRLLAKRNRSSRLQTFDFTG